MTKKVRNAVLLGVMCAVAYLAVYLARNILSAVSLNNQCMFDGSSVEGFVRQYLNDRAPMYYVDENLELRPLLLIFYTNDIPCRPEENELFYVSVKRFLPDADITKVQLEGEHCSGKNPEPDGETRTEKLVEQFVKSH